MAVHSITLPEAQNALLGKFASEFGIAEGKILEAALTTLLDVKEEPRDQWRELVGLPPDPLVRCCEFDFELDRRCNEPAVWMRFTQFSGDHPYCDKHARAEENFGQEDPSYFFWQELPSPGQLPEKRA